jgi:transcription elongation factor Elf1
LNPSEHERAEACHWLVDLTNDPLVKRTYLEEILSRNLGDARARRKLAILNGELAPDEVIQPDELQISPRPASVRTDPTRFDCPNCGARMVFSPDGNSLVCENCGTRRDASLQPQINPIEDEASFTVAMATMRGHSKPVQEKIIACQGCGAEFHWDPAILSGNCPYCEAPYAENQAVKKQIIQPDRLIPFVLEAAKVRERLNDWLRLKNLDEITGLSNPRGFYFPAWIFDLGGQLFWTGQMRRNKKWESVHGTKVLYYNDIIAPASTHFKGELQDILQTYDLTVLTSFDPRYLAGWTAETYQIPVGDASISVRKIVLDKEKSLIAGQYEHPVRDLKIDGSSMTVDTYQLALLPVWLVTCQIDQTPCQIAINGYNGKIVGDIPEKGFSRWMNAVFDRPD